jgi:sialate O-acetylesterase
VQLASFKVGPNVEWAELREAQAMALQLRNTGMAVTVDIGDPVDVHPKNKQDVGLRLGLAARAIAYGEKLVYSGPVFRQLTGEGRALRVWFDHTGGGLRAREGDLRGFTIAGKDGRFVPAEARIENHTVVVSNPEVKEPVAVRYAWADVPDCNLFNAEGLPAVPFRTDVR